jgi:hypothetical protein
VSGIPSSARAGGDHSKRGLQPAVAALAALAGYLAITILVMWPAISHGSTTVMGDIQPNDATAGGVWLGWQLQSLTPFATHTAALNAPFGTSLWQPTYITALAWVLPLWLFAHLFGAVGSWNAALVLGYVADGMAMFGLVTWLLKTRWIAFVAGVLFAFSAFNLEASYSHIGYLYTFIFPLILWTGLAMLARPSSGRGLLFGLSVAAAAYVDGYYIVFAPILAVILAAGGLIGNRRLGIDRSSLLKPLALGAALYVLLVIPIVATYLNARSSVTQEVGRSEATVYFYGARLWEYFLPWSQSPIWGHWVGGLWKDLLGKGRGSGVLERTLYLGFGVVLLAAGCWIGLAMSRRFAKWEQPRLPVRFLAVMLPAAALAAMLSSFAAIGPVPGVPILIWHVEPFWRVYSRLFIAVDSLLVMAAALTLAFLAADRRRWLAPLLAVLAVADGCAFLPWSSWSYTYNAVAAYSWLAAHPDGSIVAAYPLLQPPKWAYEFYLSFQPYQRHPLFNGAPIGSPGDSIERGLADLSDPQTLPGLWHYGVRYVIVDTKFYQPLPNPNATLAPVGLQPIASDFDVTLFRIKPQLPSLGIVTVKSGFYQEMVGIPHMHRWMSGSRGKLGIVPFSGWTRAHLTFLIRSYGRPRTLTIIQDGSEIWRGSVSASVPTPVSMLVARHGALTLRTSPAAQFVPGFTVSHYFSLNVFDFSLSRVYY